MANRTVLTDEKLFNCIKIFQECIDILNDVASNGISIAKACRKRGIDYIRFHHLITHHDVLDLYYSDLDIESYSKNYISIDELVDPYENLYLKLFGKEILYELPEDYKESVDYVLDSMSEHRREVIQYRYGLKDGNLKSYKECADLIGISKQRASQIEDSALNEMVNIKNQEILRKGLKQISNEEEKRKELSEKKMELTNRRMKLVNESIDNELLLGDSDPKEALNVSTDKVIHVCKSTTLSSLKGISVRSCNALSRDMYFRSIISDSPRKWDSVPSVYDILSYTDDDLEAVRNAGKKTVQNIIDSLDEFLKPYGFTRESFRAIVFP